MIAQERYDKIIASIEEQVTARSNESEGKLDPQFVSDVAFKAGDCDYLDNRSRNEVFKFMVGKTFQQYLSDRIIMHTYDVLLKQDEYDEDELLNISGFSQYSALYKKFKEAFGLSPKETFETKDHSLYEQANYWDTLSEAKRVEFVEIIKEVPVPVIIRDRKPFFIFGAVIFAFILAIILIARYSGISYWKGDYVAFSLDYSESVKNAATLLEGKTYSIDPVRRTLIISEESGESRNKISLKDGSMTWEDSSGNKYDGLFYNDGSIIFTINGDEDSQLRLIKTSDYEKWKEKWDGEYQVLSNYNNFWLDDGATISIYSDQSWCIYNLTFEDDSTYIGYIWFISDEHMAVYFGEEFTVPMVQFDYVEDGSFNCVSMDDGTVLAKCYRFLEHN